MPDLKKTVWDADKDYGDAMRGATAFDAAVAFDSASIYFNGFNQSAVTPEGEVPKTWSAVEE